MRLSYFPSGSLMHRMDAVSKFIWLLVAAILPFFMWQPWQVLLEVAVLFAMAVVLGGMAPGAVLRSWVYIAFLGSLILFFHVWSRQTGVLLAQVWFFHIYSDGVAYGILYGCRVTCMMCSSNLFVRTTNPRDLIVGFIHLGINYRYAWMVYLALLSVPVFETEYDIVKAAQEVRGTKPGPNRLEQRLQMYSRYMKPMLASALRRVEYLAIAMDSRAFGSYPDRTFIEDFAWSRNGLVLLLVTVCVFIALIASRLVSGVGGIHFGY